MDNNFLAHYGTPRHSGRYPWGSGENPYQHEERFMKAYERYKKEGLDEEGIRSRMNMTKNEFNNHKSIARAERITSEIAKVHALAEKGYGPTKIGRILNMPEGTVRERLKNKQSGDNAKKTDESAKRLMSEFRSGKKLLDVGAGVEKELGIASSKLKTILEYMKGLGYDTVNVQIDQAGTTHKTSILTLVPPGSIDKNGKTQEEIKKALYSYVMRNLDKIDSVGNYKDDSDEAKLYSSLGIKRPVAVEPSRVVIRYADEGGKEKDGTIEIRQGVDDLAIPNGLHYAQVRIDYNDTHYLKGVALYGQDKDFPPGVDIIFNTHKEKGTPPEKVFKPLKETVDKNGKETGEINWENPFGAAIRRDGGQPDYISKSGEKKQSLLNIVNDEGDWEKWSKNLASQFLSKQDLPLIKRQLDLDIAQRRAQLEDLNYISNPVLKSKLLRQFGDKCDAAAVDLKAAPFPGQTVKVLLPCTVIGQDEVYAPHLKTGTKVCLIRYPHQGTFEIPQLTVNNDNVEARKLLGNLNDAIGVNTKALKQLSGADCDGDTAVVIPLSSKVKIKREDAKDALDIDYQNFDPDIYGVGHPTITERSKGLEMGKVTNLITDMTFRGAPKDEVYRVAKQAQVVIDAFKHQLDWKQSAIDFGIDELKRKWQGTNEKTGQPNGASTIVSRAKGQAYVPVTQGFAKINPQTGEYEDNTKYEKNEDGSIKLDEEGNPVLYRFTTPVTKKVKMYDDEGNPVLNNVGKQRTKAVYALNPDGTVMTKDAPKFTKTTRMAAAKDAMTLVGNKSDPKEISYAQYANTLKSMANEARKMSVNVEPYTYSPAAAETYATEVDSLKAKLDRAESNAPRERQAQLHAYKARVAYKDEVGRENVIGDEMKKRSNLGLQQGRALYGAKKQKVEITDKEWEAIQAGALRKTTLDKVFDSVDDVELKKLAIPRQSATSLTPAKIALIKSMSNSGYLNSEIAEEFGVSPSTISKVLTGKEDK